jgi:hypothetical protein
LKKWKYLLPLKFFEKNKKHENWTVRVLLEELNGEENIFIIPDFSHLLNYQSHQYRSNRIIFKKIVA